MNAALFAANLKTHMKNFFSYGIGSVLYLAMIIWIFPSVSNTDMEKLIRQLPKNLIEAFNFTSGISSADHFVANEFYGLLYLLIMAIFAITTAVKLIAHHVDRGSMAFILAAPQSRVKVALTQAATLVFGLLLIAAIMTVGGWLVALAILGGDGIPFAPFFRLNAIGFLLFYTIAGYAFFFSCLFNDEKRALSVASLLTLVFYVLDLVGRLSDRLDWCRHLSVFAAYRPQDLLDGTAHVAATAIGLFAAGTVLYLIGIALFSKRDLPL
jgi:ABC-2 type transport system permease protein